MVSVLKGAQILFTSSAQEESVNLESIKIFVCWFSLGGQIKIQAKELSLKL
jgi:hypothetical protein